jgi:hypothetical protein
VKKIDPFLFLLFLLLLFISLSWLHRVPGLMGDEASEGENVFLLLTAEQLTLTGERSYIGPAIDYLRLPFIGLFGYSALALRLPLLLATLVSFWLAADLFTRWWGRVPAYFALLAFFFSPIYLTQQRLGWAIALFPFFALLLLWLLFRPSKIHTPLIAGLVSGLALSNHVLFLPTLVAIWLLWLATQLRRPATLFKWWPVLVGFFAGFGTQLVILQLSPEDQGDPAAVASLFTERLQALPLLSSPLLSGSSYIARYTGVELSPLTQQLIVAGLIFLIILTLFFQRRRAATWLHLLGLTLHLLGLLYLIDRFTLRYFVLASLAVWALAGVGLGSLLQHFLPRRLLPATLLLFVACLISWHVVGTLLPFLGTGGSLADFSLGNRTNSARDLVAIEPLLACLTGAGAVYSDNIHLANRLLYLSYSQPGFFLSTSAADANYVITYRDAEVTTTTAERCPALQHFRVSKT